MIDNEIIKALEWCEQFEHNIVFKGNGDEKCVQALQMMVVIKHALKEYNRQKAKIERLQKAIKVQDIMIEQQDYKIKTAKSEARKELAERLCKDRVSNDPIVIAVKVELKEMADDNFTKIEHNSLCETETYKKGES